MNGDSSLPPVNQGRSTPQDNRNRRLAAERDAAIQVAVDNAVLSDEASDIALAEALRRDEAERAASSARAMANQASMEAARARTESGILRENLAEERQSASQAGFAFYLMAFLVFASLVGLGIWYFAGTQSSSTDTTRVATPVSTAPPRVTHDRPVQVNVPPPQTIIIQQPARTSAEHSSTKSKTPTGAPPADPAVGDSSPDGASTDRGDRADSGSSTDTPASSDTTPKSGSDGAPSNSTSNGGGSQ